MLLKGLRNLRARGWQKKTINWAGGDAWSWTRDQFQISNRGLDWTRLGPLSMWSHHLWPWEDEVLHLPLGEHPFEGGLGHFSEKGQGPSKGRCALLLSPSLHPVRDAWVKGPSLWTQSWVLGPFTSLPWPEFPQVKKGGFQSFFSGLSWAPLVKVDMQCQALGQPFAPLSWVLDWGQRLWLTVASRACELE